MNDRKLPSAADNPVAAAIRGAIGASDDEEIIVSTPQFERTVGMPAPSEPPAGWAAFSKLYELSSDQLKALGCGNWDGGLFLFPHEWYEHIPQAFPVEDINGHIKPFKRGETDDDKRFGCLSYGIRIGPSTDGED